jgi:hypothetical protein
MDSRVRIGAGGAAVQVAVDGDEMKGMALRTDGGNLKGEAGDGIAALRRDEGESSRLGGRSRAPSAKANNVIELGPEFLGCRTSLIR